tara:strand:+ start:332 stop:727 length:396 start_codon:yes stop_codon:yes gene_type:complete
MGGILMDWWNILKVDIDFAESLGYNPPGEFTAIREKNKKTGESNRLDPRWKDPRIRIYPAEVVRTLTRQLGRKPTDEEIEESTVDTIRHESGHAAHHQIQGEDWHDNTYDEHEDFAHQFETRSRDERGRSI